MQYLNRAFVRNAQIIFRMIGGESVLVDPYRREMMRLNPAGADIWNLVDGARTLGDIVAILKDSYDADEDTIRKDAESFMKELIELEMVR